MFHISIKKSMLNR